MSIYCGRLWDAES